MTSKKAKKWKGFSVRGIHYTNDGMRITRLQWIKKYVSYGSKFVLEREPDNKHDRNAIKIRHALKSGKKIMIGYVPRELAAEWVPLMDDGFIPQVKFQMKFIAENDNPKKGIDAGDCTGLLLRYELN